MRTLTDTDGRRWTVYAVDADIGDGAGGHYLPDDYRYGWLVFECEGRKLRLAPIPPGWDDLPEPALREAFQRARASARATGELFLVDPPPAGPNAAP